jgi:integrase
LAGWRGRSSRRSAWPKLIRTARRRAVTAEEHERIIAAEKNTERRNFYEFLWETGCSQTDAANLRAEDIDWSQGSSPITA